MPTKLDLSGFKNKGKNKGKALGGVRKVYAEVVDDEPRKMADEIFMYKGKKYNAWQALGVPAGADASEIKAAFAEKSAQDAAHKDFYFKAMQTVL